VSDTHGVPFSKGLLAQSLTATGLPPDRAYRVAQEVQRSLREQNAFRISIDELHPMVGRVLGEMEGERYLRRYDKWHRLSLQDRPVIILIGGTTGVGKSTLATQLANRLGIVRVISTDSIRQVMRTFFSKALMPEIHYSSFDAGGAVRIPVGSNLNPHLVGFVEQVEMVTVGVSALVDRAVSESVGTVVEGVHVVPGYFPLSGGERAVVLPMIVAVREAELHRSHFLVREQETGGQRAVQRYLANFDAIRRIQEFLLSQAAAERTLVIENESIDDTVGMVLDALYERIEAVEAAASHARTSDGPNGDRRGAAGTAT
jgi:2-phosphoglycerate kinase